MKLTIVELGGLLPNDEVLLKLTPFIEKSIDISLELQILIEDVGLKSKEITPSDSQFWSWELLAV